MTLSLCAHNRKIIFNYNFEHRFGGKVIRALTKWTALVRQSQLLSSFGHLSLRSGAEKQKPLLSYLSDRNSLNAPLIVFIGNKLMHSSIRTEKFISISAKISHSLVIKIFDAFRQKCLNAIRRKALDDSTQSENKCNFSSRCDIRAKKG